MARFKTLFLAVALMPSLATAASPSAEDVRRWLNELLFLHAPAPATEMALETARDPKTRDTESGVAAVMPGAVLWLDDAALDLGDLAIEVAPGKGARFDVAILVPPAIPVSDRSGSPLASLRFEEPVLTGTWDEDLGMFVTISGSASTVQLIGARGARAGAVQLRHTVEPADDGAFEVTNAFAVAGLQLVDGDGSTLTVESLAIESTVAALDLTSYRALVEATGFDPLSFDAFANLEPEHLRVLADFYERIPPGASHQRLRATGVSLRPIGGVPLRTDSLDVATDADPVSNGNLTLRQRGEFDGLGVDVDSAEGLLAPRDADVTLVVERLPLVALARAAERHGVARGDAAGQAALMAELPRILADAGTEIRIVDSRFRGPLLTATFDGYARPDGSPRGATGMFTVQLAGFAGAQQQLAQSGSSVDAIQFAAALAVIELIGEPVDADPDARRYRLELVEGGGVTLNGTPIGELLALLMPQDP